ncbi:MAG: beta-ketoacyl-[acyl-carrier-protein] synthase family protein [Verrucomicrobiota bacterium]
MLFPPSSTTSTARVVITGAGIITALGQGWRANADGFRTGRTAFRPVSVFDASRQRVQVAAEVDLPEDPPATALSPRRLNRMDRAGRMLLLAALEAWQQCGWEIGSVFPMVFGTTSGGMPLGEAYFRHAVENPLSHQQQATRVTNYQAQQQALDLADALGVSGSATIIANACASGANAVGHAFDLVRHGRAERALACGYDALSHMVFAGFDSLQALSPTQCRPFDARRDGLGLGEGAAVLALESLDVARRRGASILGEVAGYGASIDVHHLTQPHPEGRAARAAMSMACRDAGVSPEQIDYLNAHGTGTPLNDSAEAAAINEWAGAHAKTLPVTSTKANIGHLLGAAGAVETVVSLMALREQWIPPETTLEARDAACAFPVPTEPRAAKLEHVLTNSFGFGGSNASLILRRWS